MSKTKIMLGYQCHKNLYWALHKKDLIPPVTPELQALFDQGNAVTAEARKRFPNGVLVDNPAFDFVGSLKKTRELLAAQTPHIYEAAFEYKGCYARADIISYNPLTQRWSVIEVKSSTKVKDEHMDDVGLQIWIMANAGLPIEKISILHLNNLCQFPNLENLFTEEDVTDKLREKHTQIAPRLNELFVDLRKDTEPQVDIGEHCFKPRECQFMEYCWGQKKLPSPNIFDIPGIYDRRWKLYEKGAIAIADIPENELNEKQQICLKVLKTGERFIDHEKIKSELATWKFPLVFLDFETINPAIPRYPGTNPFMQVPFQYSVHVLKSLDAEPVHYEFLFDNEEDPRPTLIPQLIQACKGEGSVVAYYAKFEAGCLEDLAEYSPDHKEELLHIKNRLVDPLPLIKEAVYDSEFKDSYSIKSVGPALLGEKFSYKNKLVGDGGAAQRAFEEIINPSTFSERISALKKALLEYCEQDTLVMVELVKWLYDNAKS
ncbi:MAG: DUF2779 domain-containing protein [Pseudobdellovibrio sp.]